MNLEPITPSILIPALTIIANALKGTDINKKYLPFVNVVLGALATCALNGLSPSSAVWGVIFGGASVGLYEIGKNTKKIKEENEGYDI